MAVTNPYTTVADINTRFKDFTIDGSSDPTDTQVTGFIAQISDKMEEMFKACGIDTDDIDAGKSDKLALMCGYGTLSMVYRYLDVADDKEQRYWSLFKEDMKAIEKRPAILGKETNVKNSIVGTYPTRETPFTRFSDNW